MVNRHRTTALPPPWYRDGHHRRLPSARWVAESPHSTLTRSSPGWPHTTRPGPKSRGTGTTASAAPWRPRRDRRAKIRSPSVRTWHGVAAATMAASRGLPDGDIVDPEDRGQRPVSRRSEPARTVWPSMPAAEPPPSSRRRDPCGGCGGSPAWPAALDASVISANSLSFWAVVVVSLVPTESQKVRLAHVAVLGIVIVSSICPMAKLRPARTLKHPRPQVRVARRRSSASVALRRPCLRPYLLLSFGARHCRRTRLTKEGNRPTKTRFLKRRRTQGSPSDGCAASR